MPRNFLQKPLFVYINMENIMLHSLLVQNGIYVVINIVIYNVETRTLLNVYVLYN
jgi:hypothetical protein